MGDGFEPREPESSDLLKICDSLNKVGARYVVIGGMAMVLHGFNRGTEAIDLLVDRTAENIACLREALSILPDNAVRDVRDSDIEEYEVVRVADEVVVDLMGSACGIRLEEAEAEIDWREIEGVRTAGRAIQSVTALATRHPSRPAVAKFVRIWSARTVNRIRSKIIRFKKA